MAEANENYVLFYIKNSKLFSVNAPPHRSRGSGRPKSGPD